MTLQAPPNRFNSHGQIRRVGVEVEFAGLPPRDTAELVCGLFGGELNVVSPHRLLVEGTRWGEFGIELDTQYAHPVPELLESGHESDSEWARQQHQRRVVFHQKTRELIGDMVTGLVPTEIVCPPVPWNELETLDTLFQTLRDRGAKGTDASLLYGFGLHLNPEVERLDVDYLLTMMRAYLLLASWLRDEIKVDITREVLPHANPFPKEYALKILDFNYQPDLDSFIEDYLHFNPTRNRELDLLPLFAYLRPEHPHPLLHTLLIKPRPTFHYRLPNAQLSQLGWGSVMEWNRWVEVEKLAANASILRARCDEYIAYHNRPLLARFKEKLLSLLGRHH
ncbi:MULTISPECIES: amidoligase family protein [unclassified Halomonas]|uniref:amidoligase family protein n=1 Tax=unclassified Halomonas TaxID=2609666 RepID=UPI0009904983|nr:MULTISPECIES: amidoligase family protein [unclassified Halomonas]AQU81466.1 amidoligase enzyme [Halomonas sp. 'Soap Lake \